MMLAQRGRRNSPSSAAVVVSTPSPPRSNASAINGSRGLPQYFVQAAPGLALAAAWGGWLLVDTFRRTYRPLVARSAGQVDAFALLNPDAFPEPAWLEALVAAAERHPDVAAFASQMRLDGSPDRLDGAGDSYHVSGRAWRNESTRGIASNGPIARKTNARR